MSRLALHADWCRQHFNMMAEGGIWAVPRSGLIFTKRSEDPPALELTMAMPWTDELEQAAAAGADVPADAQALIDFQLADFDLIREHFQAAGIAVTGRDTITREETDRWPPT